jgi:hypothetical protein
MLHPMRKVRLEEFIPQPVDFKLRETGKTYRLRAWNLGDAAWAHARYGEKRVGDFFGQSPDPAMIAAFAFRLMDEKDQDDFAARACRYRDADTGVISEETSIGGGPLLATMVHGPSETLELLTAVRTSIGLSQPLLDKLKKKVEENHAGDASSRRLSSDGDSIPTKSAG